jgi:hypothetical protein
MDGPHLAQRLPVDHDHFNLTIVHPCVDIKPKGSSRSTWMQNLYRFHVARQ